MAQPPSAEQIISWLHNPSIMSQPPRAKQIKSLHFSVDYAFFHSTTATEKCLWTHPFENRTKLSPFVSRGSNLYRAPQGKIESDDCVTWVSWPSLLGKSRLYTNNVIWVDFKQLSLPFSVDYAYWYIIYTSYFKQLQSSVVCKLWVSIFYFDQVIAYDHSTTATAKCLWTHPFDNRTKLSPFVLRGSNLYRAPQGKIPGGYSSMILVGTCRWDLKSRPIFIPNFAENYETHFYTRATNFMQSLLKMSHYFQNC